MLLKRLFSTVLFSAIVLAACASPTPALVAPTMTNVPTLAPSPTAVPAATATTAATTAPTKVPAPTDTLPYPHTACSAGVNLAGQTINLYHVLALGDQVDTLVAPAQAGYADATAYLNAHGGLCGATIGQVYPDATQDYDPQAIYTHLAGLQPRPALIVLYGTGDAEQLRDQLANDHIPALGFRAGSVLALYGANGQTPGWVFSTNPLYMDQIGSVCDFVAAHPDRYPHPVIGFIAFDDAPSGLAVPDAGHAYCAKLGIGYAGAVTTSGDDEFTIQPKVEKLVKAGATIIYTNANEGAPASIAKNLVQMGVQTTVTVAGVNFAFYMGPALLSQPDLGQDGLPMANGMIGSHPLSSLGELGNPGMQLIAAQADANQRAADLRLDPYVKAWSTTDLFREVYVQTGNRVGYDHVTGAEIKATLEKIVYATLGGVERLDFQGGARRAPAANRIGQLGYLGLDGQTAAGPGNPPKNFAVRGYLRLFQPIVVPLTDYQPAPDLRAGGQAVLATPAATVVATTGITATGRIVYFAGADHSPDNSLEIYLIHPDGSGKIQLTHNHVSDDSPALSPDGQQIAFVSNRDGNDEIYIMPTPASQAQADANDSHPTRLTNNPGSDGSPQWSPDGKKIVFQSDRDGNSEIYVMNADGSGVTRLTNNPAADGEASWSPDGRQIAFDSDRTGNAEVYVMRADGSGIKDLTNNPAIDVGPDWSPDGKRIAYISASSDGHGQVYVMQADGSHPINLSNSQTNDFTVTWSPDGAYLAFSRDLEGIDIMRADGSGQIALTHDPSEWAITPNWGK